MFFAHFPELSDDFAEWDRAVERVQSARASFLNELASIADRVGVDPETYDRENILMALAERTRPSLHLALEEWPAGRVPVRGTNDGRAVVAGIQTDLGSPPSELLSDVDVRALVQPLVDLCNEARKLRDVQNIAHAQDALTAKIQPLTDELKLHRARETIPVATNCPICQVNL